MKTASQHDRPFPPGVLTRWYLAQPVPRVAGAVVRDLPGCDMGDHVAALRQLLTRHPSLNHTLPPSPGDGSSLAPVPAGTPLPLSCGAHADPVRELEHLFHRPYAGGQPLYQIRVCGQTGLALAVHHALADGLSIGLLVRDYLRALAGEALPPPDPLDALPLEARVALPHPATTWLPRALRNAMRRPRPVYLGPQGEPLSLTTHLCETTLAAEHVTRLRARSRAEGTTVHGALCAAALVAALPDGSQQGVEMRLSTPVSLRKRGAPEPKGVGLHLCSVDTSHRVGPAVPFWELARECHRAIARGIRPAMGELRLLQAFRALASIAASRGEAHPQRRTATVEVSNLGVCDVGQAQVHFAQGNHYHGPLFNLSVLSNQATAQMSITLATPYPYVSQVEAEAYLKRAESHLLNAVAAAEP